MKKLFLIIALVGCKQGAGDRCQVDDDCSSGLICNQAKLECQSPGGSNDLDASIIDAPKTDAQVILDAPADAATDAPIDSTTPPVDTF